MCVLMRANKGMMIRGLVASLFSCVLAGTAAELEVRVVDSQDNGIANALVKLTSLGQSRKETTEPFGAATFRDLAVGRYSIRIEAAGYKVWQIEDYAVGIRMDRPLQATLSVGELGCPPVLRVMYDNIQPRGAAVRGTVVDAETHKGIAGARITLRRFDGGERNVVVRSGQKGQFMVMAIDPGRYKVQVTKGSHRADADLVVPVKDAAIMEIVLEQRGHVQVCL